MYTGTIHFRMHDFLAQETHNEHDIIGKYAIAFDISKYKPRLFVMGIKDDEDAEGLQRPTIFYTEEDVIKFMQNLYFPQYNLRCLKLTRDIYVANPVFPKYGAYMLRESQIIIPKKPSIREILKKRREEHEQ